MTIFGGIIRHMCYQSMGSMFTVERSIRKDHILVTWGPYAIVRHPSYTGLLIVFIGMILIHGTKVRISIISIVTNTKSITAGLLGAGEWRIGKHGDEKSDRICLCTACIYHSLCSIWTDVERG